MHEVGACTELICKVVARAHHDTRHAQLSIATVRMRISCVHMASPPIECAHTLASITRTRARARTHAHLHCARARRLSVAAQSSGKQTPAHTRRRRKHPEGIKQRTQVRQSRRLITRQIVNEFTGVPRLERQRRY